MLDAVSGSHFARSCPRTSAWLESRGISSSGSSSGSGSAGGDSGSSRGGSSRDDMSSRSGSEGNAGGDNAGKQTSEEGFVAFEFLRYSAVGYNSLPNVMPLLTGHSVDEFEALLAAEWAARESPPGRKVLRRRWKEHGRAWVPDPESEVRKSLLWEAFKEGGYVTALGEEIHDGCGDMGEDSARAAEQTTGGEVSHPGPAGGSSFSKYLTRALAAAHRD
ncbi:hypothetical protein T492DRAFT_506583 [Pavlovales sp. CCMP2436]|nr:hypothetical protein T492DRAFT_506583 [Pavlovales sp. CCMP2436]